MLSALLRQNYFAFVPVRQPRFSQKVKVDFTVRDYRVKTIDTAAELKQVLALRRAVFHFEFAGKWISLRSDKDEFDRLADHLAIFDEKSGRLAGCYRMIPSFASHKFYSAGEFDISQILELPGTKVELSRACIHKDYRNGIVIALLWKGIAEYAKAAKADILFGLSSINTTKPDAIAKITRYFAANDLIARNLDAEPTAEYRIDDFAAHRAAAGAADDLSGIDAVQLVPSLFKTYIKAGAKVCSQPVIDRDFRCADWLTVLDMRKLSPAFGRKFMQE
jgi:putative hemolysin